MIDFYVLLGKVMIFVALAVPGFIMGKLGKISDSATNSISNILTDIGMPFLVLSKLLETDMRKMALPDILCASLLPVIIVPILFLCTLAIFRVKGNNRDKTETDRYSAIFSNCGFLGIPLAISAFPDSPEVAVFVSLFNVISTFLLLTLGIYILSGDIKHIDPLKAFCKPITVAVIIGAVLSLTGVGAKLTAAHEYSSYLASITTPLSMIVLGFELSKIKLKKLFMTPSVYAVSAIKLIAAPVFALGILLILKLVGIAVGKELAAAVFIATAVATPATTPAMAARYGADSERAAIHTVGTTLLCVISLPLVSLLFDIFF